MKPLPEEMRARRQDRMEDLVALHAQHFPLLRQALATPNEAYVRRRASGEIERHLREHCASGSWRAFWRDSQRTSGGSSA
jgi:hypothetical protein